VVLRHLHKAEAAGTRSGRFDEEDERDVFSVAGGVGIKLRDVATGFCMQVRMAAMQA